MVRGTNQWLLRESLTPGPATISFRYGRLDDWPLMCDWNGDGVRTPGVVRAADNGRWQWFLRDSLAGGAADTTFHYGRWDLLDEPICGNWDGLDGQTVGVVRHPEVTGSLRWLLRNANAAGAADLAFSYGRVDDHADLPWVVVGDWNGNDTDTPGLVRFRGRLLWQLRTANAPGPADFQFSYGLGDRPGGDDRPIVGDWNGDGFDTVGVVRGRGLERPLAWLLRNTLSPGAANVEFSYARGDDWPMVWR